MPIKFSCGSCGSVLRVAEQHIGKQAKCPKCGQKCVVPPESEPAMSTAVNTPPQPAPAQPTAKPKAASIGTPSVGPPNVGPPVADPDPLRDPLRDPLSIGTAPAADSFSGLPSFGDAPASPIASPIASPLGGPAAADAPAPASPYAAPLPSTGSSGGGADTIMHPLYQARSMMNWFGWFLFVIGCIYCVTIIGAIIGWLPLWMGQLIKGASKSIKLGVERGDQNQLRLANQRLATFFKICGVITIIYVCLIGIWIVLMLVAVILGAVNAA